MNGDICSLQDGGTSVLVDNTILPLGGLNGSRASGLEICTQWREEGFQPSFQ